MDTPRDVPQLIQHLRLARRAAGLTQKDVAARLGFRQSQISIIECGEVDPRLSTVVDLARAVGHELLLVPRDLVAVIESLVTAERAADADKPLYALDGPAVHDPDFVAERAVIPEWGGGPQRKRG